MNIKNNLLKMSDYHVWATEKLLESIQVINDNDYKNDIKMFFKSIHGTLNHLLLTDKIWYGRFISQEFIAKSLSEELSNDRENIKNELCEQTKKWKPFIESLSENVFSENLIYKNMSSIPQSTEYSITLSHVFNHATHHRGQITTAINQLGYQTPSLDLIYFVRL